MVAIADTVVDTPARRRGRWADGLDWRIALGMAILHLGILAAPFFFTWKAVWLTLLLSWLTGGLGICLGFHRLLTHRSFETYRPVRWLIAWLGTMAGQGPPIMWVATHREHHRFSDQESDPHSPRHGAWWSHILWMLPHHGPWYWGQRHRRYARDLLREPFMRFLGKSYVWWHLAAGVVLFAVGWLGWGWFTGVSFLLYGLFVRQVYVWHVTWLVNSATHLWGYRNYDTPDDSRNLWWVGLLAFGEGWHNNHHASQRSARHGRRWWELDTTYAVIWLMEHIGLAWNVMRPEPTAAPHRGAASRSLIPSGASNSR
jgi:stearoyl-CoA desaturase (delta-9 desaturase)